MTDDHDFRIRPGRIRSTSAQRARPFIAQALAAAQRAGGSVSRQGKIGSGARSRFGRGQRASIQANRLITARSRAAVSHILSTEQMQIYQRMHESELTLQRAQLRLQRANAEATHREGS